MPKYAIEILKAKTIDRFATSGQNIDHLGYIVQVIGRENMVDLRTDEQLIDYNPHGSQWPTIFTEEIEAENADQAIAQALAKVQNLERGKEKPYVALQLRGITSEGIPVEKLKQHKDFYLFASEYPELDESGRKIAAANARDRLYPSVEEEGSDKWANFARWKADQAADSKQSAHTVRFNRTYDRTDSYKPSVDDDLHNSTEILTFSHWIADLKSSSQEYQQIVCSQRPKVALSPHPFYRSSVTQQLNILSTHFDDEQSPIICHTLSFLDGDINASDKNAMKVLLDFLQKNTKLKEIKLPLTNLTEENIGSLLNEITTRGIVTTFDIYQVTQVTEERKFQLPSLISKINACVYENRRKKNIAALRGESTETRAQASAPVNIPGKPRASKIAADVASASIEFQAEQQQQQQQQQEQQQQIEVEQQQELAQEEGFTSEFGAEPRGKILTRATCFKDEQGKPVTSNLMLHYDSQAGEWSEGQEFAEQLWDRVVGNQASQLDDKYKITHITQEAWQQIFLHNEHFQYGINPDNLPSGFFCITCQTKDGQTKNILYYDPLKKRETPANPLTVKISDRHKDMIDEGTTDFPMEQFATTPSNPEGAKKALAGLQLYFHHHNPLEERDFGLIRSIIYIEDIKDYDGGADYHVDYGKLLDFLGPDKEQVVRFYVFSNHDKQLYEIEYTSGGQYHKKRVEDHRDGGDYIYFRNFLNALNPELNKKIQDDDTKRGILENLLELGPQKLLPVLTNYGVEGLDIFLGKLAALKNNDPYLYQILRKYYLATVRFPEEHVNRAGWLCGNTHDNFTEFLCPQNLAALDYLSTLNEDQRYWWNALLEQHCAHNKSTPLYELVDGFKYFCEQYKKMYGDQEPLPSFSEVLHLFGDVRNMLVGLDRLLLILQKSTLSAHPKQQLKLLDGLTLEPDHAYLYMRHLGYSFVSKDLEPAKLSRVKLPYDYSTDIAHISLHVDDDPLLWHYIARKKNAHSVEEYKELFDIMKEIFSRQPQKYDRDDKIKPLTKTLCVFSLLDKSLSYEQKDIENVADRIAILLSNQGGGNLPQVLAMFYARGRDGILPNLQEIISILNVLTGPDIESLTKLLNKGNITLLPLLKYFGKNFFQVFALLSENTQHIPLSDLLTTMLDISERQELKDLSREDRVNLLSILGSIESPGAKDAELLQQFIENIIAIQTLAPDKLSAVLQHLRTTTQTPPQTSTSQIVTQIEGILRSVQPQTDEDLSAPVELTGAASSQTLALPMAKFQSGQKIEQQLGWLHALEPYEFIEDQWIQKSIDAHARRTVPLTTPEAIAASTSLICNAILAMGDISIENKISQENKLKLLELIIHYNDGTEGTDPLKENDLANMISNLFAINIEDEKLFEEVLKMLNPEDQKTPSKNYVLFVANVTKVLDSLDDSNKDALLRLLQIFTGNFAECSMIINALITSPGAVVDRDKLKTKIPAILIILNKILAKDKEFSGDSAKYKNLVSQLFKLDDATLPELSRFYSSYFGYSSGDVLLNALMKQPPTPLNALIATIETDPYGDRDATDENQPTYRNRCRQYLERAPEAVAEVLSLDKEQRLLPKQREFLLAEVKYVYALINEKDFGFECNEAGGRTVYKSTKNMTRTELLQHFSKCREQIATLLSQGQLEEVDFNKIKMQMLAIICEIMYRTTGKLPNPAQIIAICLALQDNQQKMLQMNTGEGKTLTNSLLAAMNWALGPKGCSVDICTANMDLARENLHEMQDFFSYLEIKTSLVAAGSPKGTYQDGGINYSTASDITLYRLSRQALRDGEIPPKHAILQLDECDMQSLDLMRNTRFNFAISIDQVVQDINHNDYDWIYPLINEFIETPDFKNRDISREQDVVNLRKFLFNRVGVESEQGKQLKQLNSSGELDKKLDTWIESALIAKQLQQDKHYVFKTKDIKLKGKMVTVPIVCILINGIPQPAAKWSNGVHQFVCASLNTRLAGTAKEAKLELPQEVTEPRFQIEAELSYVESQSSLELLRWYTNKPEESTQYLVPRIVGMSGSVGDDDERTELNKTYEFKFYLVPTNLSSRRKDELMHVAQDDNKQILAIQKAASKCAQGGWSQRSWLRRGETSQEGQPILLVCEDIKSARGMKENMQTWAQINGYTIQLVTGEETDAARDQLVAKAGGNKIITITTPLLGRGTDIQTKHPNGLMVIDTIIRIEREERQVKGRAGRQGQQGRTMTIISADKYPQLRNIRGRKLHKEIELVRTEMTKFAETERYFRRCCSTMVTAISEQFTAWTSYCEENAIPGPTQREVLKAKSEFLQSWEPKWRAILAEEHNKYDLKLIKLTEEKTPKLSPGTPALILWQGRIYVYGVNDTGEWGFSQDQLPFKTEADRRQIIALFKQIPDGQTALLPCSKIDKKDEKIYDIIRESKLHIHRPPTCLYDMHRDRLEKCLQTFQDFVLADWKKHNSKIAGKVKGEFGAAAEGGGAKAQREHGKEAAEKLALEAQKQRDQVATKQAALQTAAEDRISELLKLEKEGARLPEGNICPPPTIPVTTLGEIILRQNKGADIAQFFFAQKGDIEHDEVVKKCLEISGFVINDPQSKQYLRHLLGSRGERDLGNIALINAGDGDKFVSQLNALNDLIWKNISIGTGLSLKEAQELHNRYIVPMLEIVTVFGDQQLKEKVISAQNRWLQTRDLASYRAKGSHVQYLEYWKGYNKAVLGDAAIAPAQSQEARIKQTPAFATIKNNVLKMLDRESRWLWWGERKQAIDTLRTQITGAKDLGSLQNSVSTFIGNDKTLHRFGDLQKKFEVLELYKPAAKSGDAPQKDPESTKPKGTVPQTRPTTKQRSSAAMVFDAISVAAPAIATTGGGLAIGPLGVALGGFVGVALSKASSAMANRLRTKQKSKPEQKPEPTPEGSGGPTAKT